MPTISELIEQVSFHRTGALLYYYKLNLMINKKATLHILPDLSDLNRLPMWFNLALVWNTIVIYSRNT